MNIPVGSCAADSNFNSTKKNPHIPHLPPKNPKNVYYILRSFPGSIRQSQLYYSIVPNTTTINIQLIYCVHVTNTSPQHTSSLYKTLLLLRFIDSDFIIINYVPRCLDTIQALQITNAKGLARLNGNHRFLILRNHQKKEKAAKVDSRLFYFVENGKLPP